MKPFVSVIIPTHNRAHLLPAALDSVYGQEGIGEQFTMEVIVVDDASTDTTPDVIRRYPEVRYVRFEKNRGCAASRNAGIMASRGAYLAFLDDDDVFLPQKLRLQAAVLEAQPEFGAVYSQCVHRFEGSESLGPQARSAPSGMIFRNVLMGFLPSIPTMLIRREAFEKAGTFDETFRQGEDWDMVLRLAFHIPFQFTPGAVCVYHLSRQHSKWMTTLAAGKEDDALRSLENALAMLPDSEEHRDLKVEARARGRLGLARDMSRVGNFARMREHVRTALKMLPALVEDPRARRWITIMARNVAGSPSPISALGELCAEVKSTPGKRGVKDWTRMRSLLAEIWTAAAIRLVSGSPSRRVATGYAAAARALLYNPAKLASIVKPLLRNSMLGPLRRAAQRLVSA